MTEKPLPIPPKKFILALYRTPLRYLLGRLILLLTTKGRNTGLPRTTPVQYEEVNGEYHVGSGWGQRADWFRNLVKDPHVEVQIMSRRFSAIAEPITDPSRIADFIELRLERRPKIVGKILEMDGVGRDPNREQLEEYALKTAMVILRPV